MHRHKWKVTFPRLFSAWYRFECEACGQFEWKLKHEFWRGVTCPHGYYAGDHHFESRHCHKYPTAATTYVGLPQ